MAEEAKVPGAETIATPGEETPKEGTIAAEVNKVEPTGSPEKAPETVPLKAYLELKKDLKDLKDEMKEAKTNSEKSKVEVEGLSELAQKYPDVNGEFLKDLLNSATNTATKKIEERYTSVIEKQEAERKQAAFDKAFDNLYDKTLEENPDLPKTVDKETIKALALTPKYRNIPLAEIMQKLYPNSNVGKASSENDTRTAADRVDDIVSFDKITPEQKRAVMADPAARAKYFSWLDSQNR